MENFVVSARKYRPATFDTVVGQQHITTTLKNAIRTNQLAQAFLFCGPRGVGKTTCARILAKTINCQTLTPEGEACNTCESCVSFNRNASFNVHELDAASNNSVDDVRNLVEQVRYAPQTGKYKIYIIDEVHMLSNAAFNAFLKTLEEPPGYAIFILATTEKHKIIPTILSRCQIFDFNRIRISDIAGHLAQIAKKEDITAEPEALNLIARKADGGLRDALSMFDMLVTFSKDRNLSYANAIDNLHILDYDYYFRITDALLDENAGIAWVIFDEILKKGFDGHNFIIGLTEHFRNLLVCKDLQTIKLLEVSEQIQAKYTDQSKRASISFLVSAMNLGGQCDLSYKQSKNQKLHIELALLKMAHVGAAVRLVQGNGNLDVQKKKTESVTEVIQNDKNGKPLTENQEVKKEIPYPENQNGNVKSVSENGITGQYKSNFQKPTLKLVTDVSRLEEEVLKKPETTSSITQSITTENTNNHPFTLEDLKKYWHEYTLRLETEKRINDLATMKKPFTLEKNIIRITVESETLLSKFNQGLKAELSEFLREKLRNASIQIQADIIEIEEIKKTVYTVEQKFKFLLEKYPELREFKNSLNLEI
jgi:DNA polymerase-3 subunit gamma/tau